MRQGDALHPHPPSHVLYKSRGKGEVPSPAGPGRSTLKVQGQTRLELRINMATLTISDIFQQKKTLMHFGWSY